MCHIKWINISPLKFSLTFIPSYMGNIISHHYHSLETLLWNMPKLLSMNFHPHVHEKVLIAGSKKHRCRIRMVQNQKMGTIKLPKLGSKKRENKKGTYGRPLAQEYKNSPQKLPGDSFRRLRLSDEIRSEKRTQGKDKESQLRSGSGNKEIGGH